MATQYNAESREFVQNNSWPRHFRLPFAAGWRLRGQSMPGGPDFGSNFQNHQVKLSLSRINPQYRPDHPDYSEEGTRQESPAWICYFVQTMANRTPLQREHSQHSREFEELTYAYPVVSRRSGGVSIGVNLNVDKNCNFDCPYCQVDRTISKPNLAIDLSRIREEVGLLLNTVDEAGICRLERFSKLRDEDKHLKDIALSGDGEPTMAPEFASVSSGLASLQASRPDLDFKLILITNSTLLDRKSVLDGIGHLLSRRGEVWAKLDAGTEDWYQKVNISRISLDRIEANLIALGTIHPYKIQTLICGVDGLVPPVEELNAYLERLIRIKASGSHILEVQLHTLARKPSKASCTPVSSAFLDGLRIRIESETELHAKVYGLEV